MKQGLVPDKGDNGNWEGAGVYLSHASDYEIKHGESLKPDINEKALIRVSPSANIHNTGMADVVVSKDKIHHKYLEWSLDNGKSWHKSGESVPKYVAKVDWRKLASETKQNLEYYKKDPIANAKKISWLEGVLKLQENEGKK